MSRRALDRLVRLLDVEKDALLKGDLEKVAALIPEKESLAQHFEASNTPELKALSFKLNQNSRLLAAANSGVSDAISTLRNLRAARASLSSYDKSGKAKEIKSSPSLTDRRF